MSKKFTDADLHVILGLQAPWRQAFADKHGHERIPHGQMKLLCSNLLGLALVAEKMRDKKDGRSIQLVVAGASPGTHMLVLLDHLREWRQKRNVRITMYDPAPLDPQMQSKVDTDDTMQFKPREFTDTDARQWHNKRGHDCLVFFSDIRSSIQQKDKHSHKDEVKIAADMQAQQRWVQSMQPDYCMLKFHAPHATKDQRQVQKSFRYLHGRPYEQAYAGLFSAEYRLFCTQADIGTQREYCTAEIEGHAFYHTRFTRVRTYSVDGKRLRYDDAFAAHVARKAQALGLICDAQQLVCDAKTKLHVVPMHFDWAHARPSRVDALLVRMLEIL